MDIYSVMSTSVAYATLFVCFILYLLGYRNTRSRVQMIALLLGGFSLVIIISDNRQDIAYFEFWTTFFLAVAAFLSITVADQSVKRDRKERYLSEITIWLSKLEERVFSAGLKQMLRNSVVETEELRQKSGLSLETWLSLVRLDDHFAFTQTLEDATRDGNYIHKLARKLDAELGTFIAELRGLINTRVELSTKGYEIYSASPLLNKGVVERSLEEDEKVKRLIADSSLSLTGVNLSKQGLNIVLMARNAGEIRSAIEKAIGKVVELKVGLL